MRICVLSPVVTLSVLVSLLGGQLCLAQQFRAALPGNAEVVYSLSFSPDSKTLASAARDGTFTLWDVNSGRVKIHVEAIDGCATSVRFRPDGKEIVLSGVMSKDDPIVLWDIRGKEKARFSGQQLGICTVAYNPDGTIIVSAGGDGTVKLWDATTRKEKAILKGRRDQIFSVEFSPDGKSVVSAGWDGTIRLWDSTSYETTKVLKGHRDRAFWVAYNSNGKFLGSASADGTVKLWDVDSGKESATLTGHKGYVSSVEFSPDGKILASGGWDGTVRLWDIVTRVEVAVLKKHKAPVRTLAFSPDGKMLASGGGQYKPVDFAEVNLWNISEKP